MAIVPAVYIHVFSLLLDVSHSLKIGFHNLNMFAVYFNKIMWNGIISLVPLFIIAAKYCFFLQNADLLKAV